MHCCWNVRDESKLHLRPGCIALFRLAWRRLTCRASATGPAIAIAGGSVRAVPPAGDVLVAMAPDPSPSLAATGSPLPAPPRILPSPAQVPVASPAPLSPSPSAGAAEGAPALSAVAAPAAAPAAAPTANARSSGSTASALTVRQVRERHTGKQRIRHQRATLNGARRIALPCNAHCDAVWHRCWQWWQLQRWRCCEPVPSRT